MSVITRDHGDLPPLPAILRFLLQTKHFLNSTLGWPLRGAWVALGWPLRGPRVTLGSPNPKPSRQRVAALPLAECPIAEC
jgi:hypothetical protein